MEKERYRILSMARARPRMRQMSTRLMKPAPPSMNLVLRAWWSGISSPEPAKRSTGCSAAGATSSVAAGAACSSWAEAMFAVKVMRPATAKNMKNFFIIVFVLLVIN